MADFSQTRRRIISVIVVLAAVDAVALVYVVLPLRTGATQPAQVQQQAEEEYRQLSGTTVRLPSRYSDVVAELGKVAAENHIRITGVSYGAAPGKLSDVEDLEMHAGLAGPYVSVVKFMNSLERDKMFFIIESVGLTGQTTQGQRTGEVRLDIKLDTYLRT